MALPVKDKSEKASIEEGSYIMILQNIMQFVKIGTSLQRIHRGLPRLCCKSCFQINLIQEEDEGIWYPGVLKQGILFHAANKMLSKGFLKMNGGVEFISMSAHSLFGMYERCGMQAAVDETIFVNTTESLNSQREEIEKMGIKLGKLVSIKQAMARYEGEEEDDSEERCQQVD